MEGIRRILGGRLDPSLVREAQSRSTLVSAEAVQKAAYVKSLFDVKSVVEMILGPKITINFIEERRRGTDAFDLLDNHVNHEIAARNLQMSN